MNWKDLRYPYWQMFILLDKIKAHQKAVSKDQIRSRVEGSITLEMLEWLRSKGYIKEIIKDSTSYYATELKGEMLLSAHKSSVETAAKNDKEETAKEAFNKIKPIPIKRGYLKLTEYHHRHPLIFWLVAVIVGAIVSLLF